MTLNLLNILGMGFDGCFGKDIFRHLGRVSYLLITSFRFNVVKSRVWQFHSTQTGRFNACDPRNESFGRTRKGMGHALFLKTCICSISYFDVYPGSPTPCLTGWFANHYFFSVSVYHQPIGTAILKVVVDFQGVYTSINYNILSRYYPVSSYIYTYLHHRSRFIYTYIYHYVYLHISTNPHI